MLVRRPPPRQLLFTMKFAVLPLILASFSCSTRPGPFTPETPVERQMIGLLEKFDRWDMNGDGRLVASELTDARSRTGHEPAEIIRFFDTDGDGAITLREAQGGLDRTDEAERQARQ